MTDTSAELEKNREVYASMKKQLETSDMGRVALFHNGALIGIFNDAEDAYTAGESRYGLGNFTTQTIGARPINLGIFSFGMTARI